MSEHYSNPEDEPQIELIDGKAVDQYLTPTLKEKFIHVLVTATNGGVFDERYFRGYMKLFEKRIQDGKVTLLLSDGEPAALEAIDIVGVYPDGRTLYELGNLVTLPEFQGQRFASRLIEYRFNKIRTSFSNNPIITTTRDPKIAEKCLRLGMKEQPMIVEMKIRNPREAFFSLSDEEYERRMDEWSREMESSGFKNYFWDPLDIK